jgi:hypothetical protein
MRFSTVGRLTTATLLSVAGLLSAGCANQPRTPSADVAIKKVAVVSMLDDAVHVRKFGLTVFNSEARPLGDLDLNRLAVQTVEGRLRRARPDWVIVPSGTDPQALAVKAARPALNFYPDEVSSELVAIAKRTEADALFLVIPLTEARMTPGRGVGALVNTTPGLESKLQLQAYVALRLVDAKGEQLSLGTTGKDWIIAVPANALGVSDDLATLESTNVRDRVSNALRRQLVNGLNTASSTMGY